jgi:hypothetical protein
MRNWGNVHVHDQSLIRAGNEKNRLPAKGRASHVRAIN